MLIKEAFRIHYLCTYILEGVCLWYKLYFRSQNFHLIGIPVQGINFQEEQLDSTESHIFIKAEMENHHYGDGSVLSYVSFSMYLARAWVWMEVAGASTWY